MIYKVGILGASGRSGLQLANLLSEDLEINGMKFELGDAVAGSGKLTSIEAIPVRTLSDPPWQPVHIWIDFSRPEATVELLSQINTPIVIATTGYNDGQQLAIEAYSRRQPVLLTSNTSVGISLVTRLLKSISGKGAWKPDVVLEETHHTKKKDSPSGTAKSLLRVLEAQGFSNVQVHVSRAGNEKGLHVIRFIAEDEEVEIRHRVSDRKVFARGALVAAGFLLQQKKPGLYSMQDME